MGGLTLPKEWVWVGSGGRGVRGLGLWLLFKISINFKIKKIKSKI